MRKAGTFFLIVLLAINIMMTAFIVREMRDEPPVIEKQNVTIVCMTGKEEEPEMRSMGIFHATAYCGCAKCNGKWVGCPAKNGEPLTEGVTIASDWSVLPEGTKVYIDGIGERVCQDTGSSIKGKRIDIYMDSHEAALEFGVRNVEVFVIDGR